MRNPHCFTVVAAIFCVMFANTSVFGGSVTWIESFDSGLGRFTTPIGNGATDYVYNASNQNIDANFIRATTSNALLAPLGQSFNQNGIASMSIEITPLSLTGGRPRLGFFDISTGLGVIFIELDNGPLPGRIGPLHIGEDANRTEFEFGALTTWNFDTKYLLEIALDGSVNELTLAASAWNGGAFSLLRQETFNYASNVAFSFDAVGMGNVNDPSGQGAGSNFVASIDNMSFTTPGAAAIPQPMASVMGVVALIMLGFHQSGRQRRLTQ